jgi:hypothetical protein
MEMNVDQENEFFKNLTQSIELLDKLISETNKNDALKQWENSEISKKILQPPRFYYNPYLFKLQTHKVADGNYNPIVEDFKNFDDMFKKNLILMLELMIRMSYLFGSDEAKTEQEAWIKILKPLVE